MPTRRLLTCNHCRLLLLRGPTGIWGAWATERDVQPAVLGGGDAHAVEAPGKGVGQWKKVVELVGGGLVPTDAALIPGGDVWLPESVMRTVHPQLMDVLHQVFLRVRRCA